MSDILNTFAAEILTYLLISSVAAAVLTPLAWLLIKLARLRAAAYRHMVWLYCLVGIVAIPLLWQHAPKLKLALLPAQVAPTEATAASQTGLADDAAMSLPPPPQGQRPRIAGPEVVTDPQQVTKAFPLPSLLLSLWALGLAFMLTKLAVGWYRLRDISARAKAVAPMPNIPRIRGRPVNILVSSHVSSPVCFGLWSPVILLPQEMYEASSPHELRMVLNHELAHIERRDCAINLFQRLLEALLFFHPLVWHASSRLTQEREQICDSHVLSKGSGPADYARLLSHMAEMGFHAKGLPQVGLFEGRLFARVRSLLDPHRSNQTTLRRRPIVACTAAALLSLSILTTVRLEAKSEVTTSPTAPQEELAQTERRQSAARLHHLGKVLVFYEAEHDRLPDSLYELRSYDLGDTEQMVWFWQHVSYLGKGKTDQDPVGTAIAYDKKLLEKSNGTNVLFRDGRVEFLKTDQVAKLGIFSPRIRSAARLRGFAQLLTIYAADHEGQFPHKLLDLKDYLNSLLDPKLFTEPAELESWLSNDLRYLGKAKTTADPKALIAYDKALLETEGDGGTNILLADTSVMFEKRARLVELGVLQEGNLEVLEVKFEPIRQGKNVVRAKIENTSPQNQLFAIHIQTRSPDWGERGIGWGTRFFDSVPGSQTKWTRFAFKIQGPITDATWVRLQFYNPSSKKAYDFDNFFKKVMYTSADLPRLPGLSEPGQAVPSSREREVIQAFNDLQGHIREKRYDPAWHMFTKDYQQSEFFMKQSDELFGFNQRMEKGARFGWQANEFLALKPKSVTESGDVLTLTATNGDQAWQAGFVQVEGQWKLDNLTGYTPPILRSSYWKDLLLPQMQKRSTKHFDIYYLQGSTAEKDIDLIAGQKDKGFDQVCALLGIDSTARICMVFFEDGRTKHLATGHEGDGWATGNTIVEVYNDRTKLDPYHEMAHVLMRPFGNPPAAFSEGFAVYMSERLGAPALENLSGGQATVYQRVRELKAAGKWIDLEELLGYTNIGSQGDMTPAAYAEAGAFAKFLIDTYGKDKFLQAYKTLRNSDEPTVQQQNVSRLAQIYGKALPELKAQRPAAFAAPKG